jgi:hypothetical protein
MLRSDILLLRLTETPYFIALDTLCFDVANVGVLVFRASLASINQ